jgi:hypothetical protein
MAAPTRTSRDAILRAKGSGLFELSGSGSMVNGKKWGVVVELRRGDEELTAQGGSCGDISRDEVKEGDIRKEVK